MTESTDSKLGCTIQKDGLVFRLLAPEAVSVQVCLYEFYEQKVPKTLDMTKNRDGLWSIFVEGFDWLNKWYTYSLDGPQYTSEFEYTHYEIADPYSTHVANRNHYLGFYKSLIHQEDEFDWEGTDHVFPDDISDLIIYETHIKDMVAHPSAIAPDTSCYNGFIKAQKGGLNHLKNLGVNAIEFLPLQKFAYYEPPFNEEIENGLINTWNPTGINYWGYMTSFFHAPESIYSTDGTTEKNALVGNQPSAIYELKSVVKACHKENMSVILDVVYNHSSQYDLNPLRFSSKLSYYRLDQDANYLNDSWTGNDLDTHKEATRNLILSSLEHWVTHYKIDGFRFDLAGIFDWEFVDIMTQRLRSLNPNCILIAEPWGGEYKPMGYSERGWSSWNDRIRNTFKGYDPTHQKGVIFGEWPHNLHRYTLENIIRGTLDIEEHGLFKQSNHSINYLESHDSYTLGDFIRMVLQSESDDESIDEVELVRLHKLGAFLLMVSQGVTMIHAGQEWARSKKTWDEAAQKYFFNHDSYNRDDSTNYLNFDEIDLNSDLYEYYKTLINIRLANKSLRSSSAESIHFKVYHDPLHITFSIDGASTSSPYDYFISINCNRSVDHEIILPEGTWEVLITHSLKNTPETIQSSYLVEKSSGILMRRLRDTSN